MTSLFKGAHQAQHYATCRPTYPKAVYDLIASSIQTPSAASAGPTRSCCIDVGCGTGQATAALVDYFDLVIGIDPSPTQLEQAIRHDRIEYRLGSVEEQLSKLVPDHDNDDDSSYSVQCITSAQAVHWFEIPIFYQHVQRILQPGGVLALWTYGLPTFPNHPKLEETIWHIYEDILGDAYWDPRRKLVENLYCDIPLIDEYYPEFFRSSSSQRIQGRPELNIQQEVSGAQLQGYVRSWSGYTKYCQTHQIESGSDEDPAARLLTKELDETATTQCIWPVAMLISVKNK